MSIIYPQHFPCRGGPGWGAGDPVPHGRTGLCHPRGSRTGGVPKRDRGVGGDPSPTGRLGRGGGDGHPTTPSGANPGRPRARAPRPRAGAPPGVPEHRARSGAGGSGPGRAGPGAGVWELCL